MEPKAEHSSRKDSRLCGNEAIGEQTDRVRVRELHLSLPVNEPEPICGSFLALVRLREGLHRVGIEPTTR